MTRDYQTKLPFFEAVDSVCDYFEGIEERIVFPAVQPGSVSSQISSSAPESGQPWSEIIADYEKIVLPATVAWAAPTFMAYFPANVSFIPFKLIKQQHS